MPEKPTYEELEQSKPELTEVLNIFQGEKGLFAALFEGSRDAIFLSDLDAAFVLVNDAACELTGYSKKELLRMSIPDLHSPEDRQAFQKYFQRIINGEPVLSEAHILRKNEEKIPVEFNNRAVLINGKTYMHTVARDISGHKRFEQFLKESERHFRTLSNAAFESIFLSENGKCLAQNLAAVKMFGYEDEDAVGRHGTEWIAPEDRALVRKNIERGYEAPYEVTALRKDGTRFPCEIQARMTTYQGRPVRITALRDISERKQAEKDLQKSEEQFRDLYDNAPVGYFEYDLQGNITRVNRTHLKMLGYTPEEIIGQPCWKFIVDEVAREQIMAKLDGVRPPAVGLERTYRRKDGTTFPVLFQDRLLLDEDGHIKGIRTAIQDITERKQAEEALLLNQKHLNHIIKIGTLVNSTLDLTLVLQGILKGTLETVNASAGMIFLKDYATGYLTWGASLGLSEAFVTEFENKSIQPGEGLTGLIDQTGESVYIPVDSAHDPRIAGHVVEEEGLNSFFGTPIYAADKIVGVMNILTHAPAILNEEDTHLCGAIALHVGLAIRNAQLFAKNQQVTELLKESEEKYRSLAEECPISIMTFNHEGLITYLNKWHLKTFAKSKLKSEFFIGKKLRELPGLISAKVVPDIEKVLQGKTVILEDVHFPKFTGGHSGYQNIKAVPTYKNGEVAGGILIREDATKRKKIEDALKYSKLQLEAVLNNLDSSVYVADMDSYEILFMNDHMKKESGEDFTGRTCWLYLHGDQTGPCEFCTNDRLVDGDGNPSAPYIWEFYNQKMNKWYECHDQAIPWTDGRLVRMEIAIDITEQKRMKNQLEELVEERTAELEDTNTALKVLLDKREKDQEDIEDKILANYQLQIEPLLTRLKKDSASASHRKILDVLESNLKDILSPFSAKLADPMNRLTPKELQIASLIKQDYSNKEIASFFNKSVRTIDVHRDNIRKKLDIKNKKINLKTYLTTLQ
jgi:PAS domain S-box-containing protein